MQLRDEGCELPEEDIPDHELMDISMPYWAAFATLHKARGTTDMGQPRPLSVQSIESYLNMAGVTGTDDRLEYLEMIIFIDSVYFQHRQKLQGEDDGQ